jgi:putative transposase
MSLPNGSQSLTWTLSHTMDTDFFLKALDAAMAQFGQPEIFNADQGFSSRRFSGRLPDAGVSSPWTAGALDEP